jgi:hypothetical protein
MSACRVTSDGGTMGMAYLTGHIAAENMHRLNIRKNLVATNVKPSLQIDEPLAVETHVKRQFFSAL